MKNILIILSSILIIASCGKYERPFITFRSPEKRLIDKTWKLEKIVDMNGNEILSTQTIRFSIEGNDSILVRTIDNISYTGSWNWLPALDGKVDKQRIIANTPPNAFGSNIVFNVKVLTSKNLELINAGSLHSYFFVSEN
jgi:hypothetical protein